MSTCLLHNIHPSDIGLIERPDMELYVPAPSKESPMEGPTLLTKGPPARTPLEGPGVSIFPLAQRSSARLVGLPVSRSRVGRGNGHRRALRVYGTAGGRVRDWGESLGG